MERAILVRSMKYYVYILRDQGVPFYVGKGTRSRMYQHKDAATRLHRNLPVHNKIRKLLQAGRQVEYFVDFSTDVSDEAYSREVEVISKLGRRDLGTGPLLNLTAGGEGVRDYVWTDARRKQQSDSLKLAHANGRIVHPLGYFGPHKEVTLETRERLSQKGKEYYQSPEGGIRRQKMSQQAKGKKRVLSDAARQKMRESALRTNRIRRGTS